MRTASFALQSRNSNLHKCFFSFAGCGQVNAPGVYSRVSWGYEWLRAQVCELSDDPPSYFQCDEMGSSAPTAALIQVLVQVQLDTNPEDTIWTIRSGNGDMIAKSQSYLRQEYNTLKRAIVTLHEGGSYALEVKYLPFEECKGKPASDHNCASESSQSCPQPRFLVVCFCFMVRWKITIAFWHLWMAILIPSQKLSS
jgi:hypothetical protein